MVSNELRERYPDLVAQVETAYRRGRLRSRCWACNADAAALAPLYEGHRAAVTCGQCGAHFASVDDTTQGWFLDHAVHEAVACVLGTPPRNPPGARILSPPGPSQCQVMNPCEIPSFLCSPP